MPVTRDRSAPYAPTSAVLSLIDRHRSKGLPSPVDGEVLGRAGIGNSLIPRTLQTLQLLDLIGEDGKPSDILEGLRLASEAEYKQRLAEWLTATYADALSFVDPATDDETKIRDAFRSYKPVAQQPRMITLFRGLFAAAGIGAERQRRSPRIPQKSAPNGRSVQTAPARPSPSAPQILGGVHSHGKSGSLPPAITGLLASLPPEGQTWTRPERDRFVSVFGAVLDFCFPTDGKQKAKHAEEETE